MPYAEHMLSMTCVRQAPVKPAPFDYHRPDSAAEAAQLLAEFGDDAKLLGGGQSLVPMLALRLAFFDHLVDISRLDELKGIERDGDSLYIGGGTTHAAVGADEQVARRGAAARQGHPVDRSLPDPQPRHDRRLDRTRRPRRRVPGRRADVGREDRGTLTRRAAPHPRRASSSPGCGRPRWRPTRFLSECDSRCGRDGAGSRWRSSLAGTAISRSPARSPPSNSTTTTGSAAAPSGCWA